MAAVSGMVFATSCRPIIQFITFCADEVVLPTNYSYQSIYLYCSYYSCHQQIAMSCPV